MTAGQIVQMVDMVAGKRGSGAPKKRKAKEASSSKDEDKPKETARDARKRTRTAPPPPRQDAGGAKEGGVRDGSVYGRR
jgi:hypothetical protein